MIWREVIVFGQPLFVRCNPLARGTRLVTPRSIFLSLEKGPPFPNLMRH
jgi:hypothetical protein